VTSASESPPISAEAFLEGLEDGTLTVVWAGDPAECVGTDPESPTATLAPAGDDPLDIEVVDQGFSDVNQFGTRSIAYGVVLRNPNPSRWVAYLMSVQLDFFDGQGGLVGSEESIINVLPGQSVAIAHYIYDSPPAGWKWQL
jgi:hypothetical protein